MKKLGKPAIARTDRMHATHAHGVRSEDGKPRPASRLGIVLLLAIVLYAMAYSVIFVGGPSFYGDDTTYLGLAENVLTGSYVEGSYIFSIRPMQIYPIAFFYWAFGVDMLTSSAWDITAFLGTIIVAFYVGKEIYDERAGLIAALLIAFFPLVVILAPTVSDDITMMFATSLAMMGILFGKRRGSRLWYLVGGMALVASPLITPEGAVGVIVALLYVVIEVLRKKIRVNLISVHLVYGILIAGFVTMIFNYVNCGNPIVTYTVTEAFYSAVGVKTAGGTYATIPSTNTDLGFYLATMFPYHIISIISQNLAVGVLNPAAIVGNINAINYNQVGYYFYFSTLGLLYSLYMVYKGDKRAYFAVFWLIAGFMYLELGPMHLSLSPFQYLMAYRLGRFLTAIAVPAVLVIAIPLADMLKRVEGARGRVRLWIGTGTVVAVITFLVISSAPINLFWYKVLYAERYSQVAMANYLGALPDNTRIFYISEFSNLPIYMGFANQSRMVAADQIKDCRQIPYGAYVVLPQYQQVFNLNYTPNPEQYCPYWQRVFTPMSLSGIFNNSITSVAANYAGWLWYVGRENMSFSPGT